jgi:hypothetical protein
LAFQDHQSARVRAIAEMLGRLDDDDREELHRLISRLLETLDGRTVSVD